MNDHPPLSQAQKARMEKARSLIKAGHYQEAASILQSVNHPLAHDWRRKLQQRLSPADPQAQKPPAKSKSEIPIYRHDVLQSMPACSDCQREIGTALLDCPHRAAKQCPYTIRKEEYGSVWILVIGLGWLVMTLISIIAALSDGSLSEPDEGVYLVFFLLLLLPLLLTAYGALVFLNSRKLSIVSQHHGQWTHTQTLFGSKIEISYPLMRVQTPHWKTVSDLPVSVLASRLSYSEGLLKRGKAFASTTDASIVYLTLVGLALRGVIRLYVHYGLKLGVSSGTKQETCEFLFSAVPDVYTPPGALEDKLLAAMPAGRPEPSSADLKTSLKALIKNTAQRAGCEIHKLARRTVEQDLKSLGLQMPLRTIKAIGLGTKFLFGDSVEKWESIKDATSAVLPKRPAAITDEELQQHLQAFADSYAALEADHYDLLDQLYRQIDDIIESDRPDASAN